MREISLRVISGLALTAHLFGQDVPNPLTIPQYKPTFTYFCSQVNVLRRLEPEYTLEAREARRQGIVVLYVEVSPRQPMRSERPQIALQPTRSVGWVALKPCYGR
jgi:hypothetical protein